MNIVSTGCMKCGTTVHHPSEATDESLRIVFETSTMKGFKHSPSKHYIFHVLDDDQDKVIAWCDDNSESLTYILIKVVPNVREFVEHSFEAIEV